MIRHSVFLEIVQEPLQGVAVELFVGEPVVKAKVDDQDLVGNTRGIRKDVGQRLGKFGLTSRNWEFVLKEIPQNEALGI